MARIRTIKPEFFSDEGLAQCTPHARLLAIALLQLADSKGRMRLIPSQIAAHAFPWEAVDLSQLLHELFTVKYLRKYRVSGREFLDIPGFEKHQRLSGKEAKAASKFPEYDQGDTEGEKPSASQGSAGMPRNREQGIKEKPTNVGKKKASGKGKTLVPEDWMPDDKLTDWFHDQQFNFTLASMVENYIDGCRSKRLLYVDHRAAFRNWSKMRHERQAETSGRSGESRAKRHHDKLREIAERSLEEERASQEAGGGAS